VLPHSIHHCRRNPQAIRDHILARRVAFLRDSLEPSGKFPMTPRATHAGIETEEYSDIASRHSVGIAHRKFLEDD
jgi:hypothetical protein